MRTIVRTMLAAAAGAALVASGTTAAFWSDPALAEGAATVADRDAPERAGLVPSTPAPAPMSPDPVMPQAPPPVEPAADPEAGDEEPGRRAAPRTAERRATAPEVVEPQVAAPPAAVQAPPAAVQAPRAEPAAPEAPSAQVPDDGERPASARRSADDDEPDDDEPDDDRRDDGSLLGGLTEPLGLSCGGSLLSSRCG